MRPELSREERFTSQCSRMSGKGISLIVEACSVAHGGHGRRFVWSGHRLLRGVMPLVLRGVRPLVGVSRGKLRRSPGRGICCLVGPVPYHHSPDSAGQSVGGRDGGDNRLAPVTRIFGFAIRGCLDLLRPFLLSLGIFIFEPCSTDVKTLGKFIGLGIKPFLHLSGGGRVHVVICHVIGCCFLEVLPEVSIGEGVIVHATVRSTWIFDGIGPVAGMLVCLVGDSLRCVILLDDSLHAVIDLHEAGLYFVVKRR